MSRTVKIALLISSLTSGLVFLVACGCPHARAESPAK